jgi:hypothetical protein
MKKSVAILLSNYKDSSNSSFYSKQKNMDYLYSIKLFVSFLIKFYSIFKNKILIYENYLYDYNYTNK